VNSSRKADLGATGPGVSSGEAPVGSDMGSGIRMLPQDGEHPGFTLWRVSLVLVAAMFVLAVVRVHGPAAWVVLTVLVGWCITWAHPLTAVAAGVETWAVQTGFGVHRFGELSFGRDDLLRLVLVLTALLAVAVVTRRRTRSAAIARGATSPARDIWGKR
jgi:hypothetical protein